MSETKQEHEYWYGDASRQRPFNDIIVERIHQMYNDGATYEQMRDYLEMRAREPDRRYIGVMNE